MIGYCERGVWRAAAADFSANKTEKKKHRTDFKSAEKINPPRRKTKNVLRCLIFFIDFDTFLHLETFKNESKFIYECKVMYFGFWGIFTRVK